MIDRRQPSTAALVAAAALVLLTLAALVTMPFVMLRRTQSYRQDIEQHATPARAALNEVNYRLAEQIAALTHAAVTGEPQYVSAYQTAIAPQKMAMDDLARQTGAMGPDFDMRLAELQRQIQGWHTLVQQNTNSAGLAVRSDYPAVIEAVHRLDEAISAYQTRRREEVARLSRLQVWLNAVFAIIAAISAAVVLWFVVRLRTLATDLAQESNARQAALERERELLHMRDEILGIVSHDLRGPLTTIGLSTQLIPGSSHEEQSEHVQTILSTTRRMQRLIQDLLDVTKLENSGVLSIRRHTLDPAAIATEAVAAHREIAAANDVDLKSSIAPGLPPICGDRDRLLQALGNLIGNALKFTPAGGIVRLTAGTRDRNVRFAVSDSGPGISPSDLPHLFEQFWQAKKTAHLGAGLGLKITRAIVDAHHGSIEVSNQQEGGACFTVEIPASSDQTSTSKDVSPVDGIDQ
jgi:signal transduction histidine kinase